MIILVGILGSGLTILFRFLGLIQSTGTFASLSQIVTTSLTAILASIFLKERLEKSFWFLFIVIIVSIYFVSTGKFALVTIKTGDIFILTGTLFLSSANIFSKLAIKSNTQPIILALGRFFFGSLFLILVSSLIFQQGGVLLSINSWALMSGLLWVISVLAFNFSLKKIGVIFLTSLLMTAPIYTMILEYLFLNRHFNSIQITAALIVVISGILIVIPKDKILKQLT